MTDRYKGVIVTFDRDIRSDDAEALLAAICMLNSIPADVFRGNGPGATLIPAKDGDVWVAAREAARRRATGQQ